MIPVGAAMSTAGWGKRSSSARKQQRNSPAKRRMKAKTTITVAKRRRPARAKRVIPSVRPKRPSRIRRLTGSTMRPRTFEATKNIDDPWLEVQSTDAFATAPLVSKSLIVLAIGTGRARRPARRRRPLAICADRCRSSVWSRMAPWLRGMASRKSDRAEACYPRGRTEACRAPSPPQSPASSATAASRSSLVVRKPSLESRFMVSYNGRPTTLE